jgi:hypothetical protein
MIWLIENWRLLAGAVISAILILIATEQYGEHRVQVKWDQDIAVRQALLDKTKQDNKEALNADKIQYDKDKVAATSKAGRDAIAGYIRERGLLPAGCGVQSSPGNVPSQGAQGTDGTPGELGTGSALEGFAASCANDALKVIRWQDLCRANHCEIE